MNNNYSSIYGKIANRSKAAPVVPQNIDNKTTSRVLGGMKAAGVTSTIVEVDGNDLRIPRIEYVEMLEKQIREMREELKDVKTKLIKLNNGIQNVKNDLRN